TRETSASASVRPRSPKLFSLVIRIKSMKLEREDRQIDALAWCQKEQGATAVDIVTRAKAVALEALALARREGLDGSVLAEPAGRPRDAADLVGAVSVALLAFCEARGLSADHCERNELARLASSR